MVLYKMGGIPIKNGKALAKMRVAGRIVAETFEVIAEHIKPGITLQELDHIAESYLRSQGAAPLYKGYRGNPPDQSVRGDT